MPQAMLDRRNLDNARFSAHYEPSHLLLDRSAGLQGQAETPQQGHLMAVESLIRVASFLT
jgi:hypothetical protein